MVAKPRNKYRKRAECGSYKWHSSDYGDSALW